MSTDRTTDDFTDYRELILPAYEKDPWVDDWDDTMAIIDDELVPAGTTTDRDDASPSEDNLWYNTEKDKFEIYNGNSWEDATPSDHSDLSSIGSDDHHTKPIPGVLIEEDSDDNFNVVESDIDHQNIDQSSLESDDHHIRPSAGDGLSEDSDENFNVDTVVDTVITLGGGEGEVATGVTTTPTHFNVYLDPSGDDSNNEDVRAAARTFWDNSSGEYKIEILEDGTDVGNPDIGVIVVKY